jgi:hypothetical protein
MGNYMREQGFHARDEILEREGYKLLCIVLAKYELQKLQYMNGAPDVFEQLMGQENTELNASIMSLAALARANDDAGGGLKAHNNENTDGVGILIIEGNSTTLSAREACNKIIHSTSAAWRLDETEKHPLYEKQYKERGIELGLIYKNPVLLLEGVNNGKEWKSGGCKSDCVNTYF